MAEYLKPYGNILTISDKRYIFSMRNRMVQIPSNFPIKDKNTDENCKQCGKREDMKHIYMCGSRKEKTKENYEIIFGENLEQMKRIYLKFKNNHENRENHKIIITYPRDPNCDPLISL